jgi:hypothetical protein
MKLMRRSLFTAFVGMVTGAAIAGAQPQAEPKDPIISSDGTARVERTPDHVDVMLGVVVDEKTASAAQTGASKVMDEAIKALEAAKFPGGELQTGRVELGPRYERRDYNDPPPKIIGYTASITLRVRATDLTAVPRIIDTALAAGCNRVDSVEFGIKEALAAREEAVRLATKAAKRKAQVMAEALDLRLGRVVNASTNSGLYGASYSARGYSNFQAAQSVAGDGQGERADTTPVVPGKIEVWAQAHVSFTAGEEKK